MNINHYHNNEVVTFTISIWLGRTTSFQTKYLFTDISAMSNDILGIIRYYIMFCKA